MTKDEQKRTEIFEAESAKLASEGYVSKDILISGAKANTVGMLLGLVPIVPFAIWFMIAYGAFNPFEQGIFGIAVSVALLISIPVHEGIHGITWAIFSKNKFKSIAFGVAWKSLTPYCSCEEALKRGQYTLGAIMPDLLLGIIPMIIACIIGSADLLLYAGFMTVCAGGDLLIFTMILREKKAGQELFLDHPTKIGLVKFEKE